MRRVSVTLPEDVFSVLEELSRGGNRSRVVADAVMAYASQRLEPGARYAGAVVVYYDHSRGETLKAVVEAQHRFLGEVRASAHVHLSRNMCIEVLAVEGTGDEIRGLLDSLRKASGVAAVLHAVVRVE